MRIQLIIGLLLAMISLAISSFYIVPQFQQALVLQFGEVVRVVKEPGMKWRIPFIQRVEYFDNRILNLHAEEKEVIAKDQKRLIVNAFAKYKITDPVKFYQTVRDEVGARNRMNPVLDSSLRQILGSVPLGKLLTVERANIMQSIQQVLNEQAQGFGITVVDVRIMRADLPKENSEAIYKRMQTEREKEAKEFRAEGAEEALRVRSRAEKERKIIVAEAQKKSQILRGEGDAIAAKISNQAYGRDPDFYAFYRSLQAYNQSLTKNNTHFILSPDNEFFRYFRQHVAPQ
jgi:membrane protease subunit HflC